MNLNSKYPINKLFDNSNFVDNQLIYTRKTDLGFLEVFYWRGFYEVYFRLHKKRYGYFITSLPTVRKAYNFLEASTEIDLTKYVPYDFISYEENRKRRKIPRIFTRHYNY